MPARGGTDWTPPGAAPAVVRAVAVLDALANDPRGCLSLSEIAREVGIPKSSASTICTALEAGGLIRRDDPGFRLGRRTVELGGAYLARMDQVGEFYEACRRSPVLQPETVRLSVLTGIDTLCLARYDGHSALRLTSGIGDRFPANASAQGKVLLSLLDDAEIERMFHDVGRLPGVTSETIRDLPRLLADLHRVRERGYGVDEAEAADHVTGLAVAVPTRGHRSPMLAVSVTLLDDRDNPVERARQVDALLKIAGALGNPMAPVAPPTVGHMSPVS